MKKYHIFSGVFDIVNQLLTRHSPFAPLDQVDELTAKPSLLSIRGCLLEFSRIKAAKTLKKFISLTDSAVHTFLEGKENQNKKRKTESYVFSGFGNCISRGWERKSTTERFTTDRFWLCTWKISSVGKDKVNNWEFCKLKIMAIVVFVMIQRVFLSWTLAPTHLFTIFFGVGDPFIFICS